MITPAVAGLDPDSPPAMSTRPSASNVAVCCVAWRGQRAGRTERAGRRVVQLRGRPHPVLASRRAVVPAGEQDSSVAEEGRGRSRTNLPQRAGRTERAGRRVVQLGGRGAATGEQDAAVGEPRRGLAEEPVFGDRGRAGPAEAGARAGIGVGDGVAAGGPIATPGAGVHGGGTMAAPPIGCQTGFAYSRASPAIPRAVPEARSCIPVPSASIVHQPDVARPGCG